jgi:SPP1 gp7 family putative phage head morphogenesis protein
MSAAAILESMSAGMRAGLSFEQWQAQALARLQADGADDGPLRVGLVPPEEAIAAMKTRGIVPPDVYYGRLQGIEHAMAFSVAGIASLDQLQQVLDSLGKALSGGTTFDTWRTDLLKAPDVLDLPRHRLDNIFRTNLQGAYARGKFVHIESNRDARPYLMYSAVNDARTRPAHAAMHGFVARANDPIWQTAMPPNGYRCRCTVISLSESQAMERMRKDSDRLSGDQKARAERDQAILRGCADEGWDYSPCTTETHDGFRLPADLAKVIDARRRKYGPTLLERLEELAGAAALLFLEAWREDRRDDEEGGQDDDEASR